MILLPYERLTKTHHKSIELGFNGNISPQFYKKWNKTIKVRQRLKSHLITYIFFMIFSFLWFCKIDNNIWENMFSLFFIIIMGIAITLNLRIWHEISKIRKQRIKEYYDYEKHNK